MTVVGPRHGLEALDPFELALVRPVVIEHIAVNHLHRPVCAHDIPREPHCPVAAPPDHPDHLMVGHPGRFRRHRRPAEIGSGR